MAPTKGQARVSGLEGALRLRLQLLRTTRSRRLEAREDSGLVAVELTAVRRLASWRTKWRVW